MPLPQDISEILKLLHAKTQLAPGGFPNAAPVAQALKDVPQKGAAAWGGEAA